MGLTDWFSRRRLSRRAGDKIQRGVMVIAVAMLLSMVVIAFVLAAATGSAARA